MRTCGRSSDLHYKYGPFSFLQGLTVISNVAASPHFQRPKHITASSGNAFLLGLTHTVRPLFECVSQTELQVRSQSGIEVSYGALYFRAGLIKRVSFQPARTGSRLVYSAPSRQHDRSPEICHTPLKHAERTFDSIKMTAEPEVSFHDQTAALCNSNITGSASDLT